MTRAIKIDTEGRVHEVNIDLSKLDILFGDNTLVERVLTRPLTEAYADLDASAVMLVDEEGRPKQLAYNKKATALYAPESERHSHFIAGDAYVIGEGFTEEGPDFLSLPERISVADIEELIERSEKR